jgi:hypothetical protein
MTYFRKTVTELGRNERILTSFGIKDNENGNLHAQIRESAVKKTG